MKNLMMFVAVIAAGCTPNNELNEPEPETEIEIELPGAQLEPVQESCEAGAFLDCDGNVAERCAADSTTVTREQCEVGCNAAAARCDECVAGTAMCSGGEVQTCGVDGLIASTESCTLGCADGDTAHCAKIVPAFLPTVCDAPAIQPALVFPSGQQNQINTDLSGNCNGGIVAQAGGPEVCIVRSRTISVDGPLEVIGQRAIAFVADDALDVDNIIDISARGRVSGPGGGHRTSGVAPSRAGGGGAGGKQRGADGGDAGEIHKGNDTGGAIVDPLVTQIFEGGAKAGSAEQLAPNYRPQGGGGGGALMLISCSGELRVTGTIEAGGGGGGAGGDAFSNFVTFLTGGGGGGAGGYVVLQGASVTVSGKLFANGGGAGSGCSTSNCVGVNGEDAAQIRARGGGGIGLGGAGGGGGFDAALPGFGSAGTSPGGGGGSTGRFQIFTPATVTPSLGGVIAQPAFEPNRNVDVR
jgi:hypothetical protein